MSYIEKEVENLVNLLDEIKDNELKALMLVIILSKCGMNEEQIIEWFKSLNK